MTRAATVYIPTLTGGEKLERCLASLQRQTVTPAIVVADNGEGEGSAAMLAERFPAVTRVAFGRNLGFGNALNRAIREVGEGAIVLLNDDATAEPRMVEELLAGAAEAEMVAAVLLGERDPSRIDSAGVLVDQTLMAFDYLCGEPVERLAGAGAPLGPTGGAALYARDAFEAVGGFDERIFLYYEDVDLALRLRAEGARCALAPAALAVHGYSLTLGARIRPQARDDGLESGLPDAALRRDRPTRHGGGSARQGGDDLRRAAAAIAHARRRAGTDRGLARRSGPAASPAARRRDDAVEPAPGAQPAQPAATAPERIGPSEHGSFPIVPWSQSSPRPSTRPSTSSCAASRASRPRLRADRARRRRRRFDQRHPRRPCRTRADRWISEPDRGQCDAMNKAFFKQSKGELVVWLNADDVLYPGAVAEAVALSSERTRSSAGSTATSTVDRRGHKARAAAADRRRRWKRSTSTTSA